MKDGKKLEPMEICYIDVPEEFTGTVIEKLSQTEKANFAVWDGSNKWWLYKTWNFPFRSRGLIGYQWSEFMTDTKGNGIYEYSI